MALRTSNSFIKGPGIFGYFGVKKVLLTGATGFIGAHCIEPLLQRGYEVVGISSKTQIQSDFLLQVDLFNKRLVEETLARFQPTHLLHLAWYAKPPDYWNSPLNLAWHEASIHLVQKFFGFGGRRVVVAGTCAEYEWGYPLCEETRTPCCPGTLYGAAKLSLSILLQKMSQLSKRSLAWGRLFHLYGPREYPMRLVPTVICKLLKNERVLCSHGQQIRDYLHVQDAADALTALLDHDLEGSINIGSGCRIRVVEIIETIAEKIGNKELIQLGSIASNQNDPPILIPCIRRS